MEKIKILVVDDHAIMRDGLRALLRLSDDMEIIGEATDGREAIRQVQALSPNVVIMDIAMPGLDGLETTHLLHKKYPQAKVLVLSQHDSRDYILTAIKAGAAGYVPKRALASELVSAIRTVHQGGSFLYPTAAAALIDGYLHKREEEPYDKLTSREKEVLKLIAEGRSGRQIADELVISLKTVHSHRMKIMKKLQLHNRADLIKYALRKGLVELNG